MRCPPILKKHGNLEYRTQCLPNYITIEINDVAYQTYLLKAIFFFTFSATFYYVFTAVGITAGAHRLWSHRSYKAKTPFRILLAIMNSAALQVILLFIYKYCRTRGRRYQIDNTNSEVEKTNPWLLNLSLKIDRYIYL